MTRALGMGVLALQKILDSFHFLRVVVKNGVLFNNSHFRGGVVV